MNSPVMAEFAANLQRINALAEAAPGFVWRLQTEAGDATAIRPFENENMLLNMSVLARSFSVLSACRSKSSDVTWPRPPTIRAANSDTSPTPQPISRTRMPAEIPARRSRCRRRRALDGPAWPSSARRWHGQPPALHDSQTPRSRTCPRVMLPSRNRLAAPHEGILRIPCRPR